jgi:PAS domain S-box-containing protein
MDNLSPLIETQKKTERNDTMLHTSVIKKKQIAKGTYEVSFRRSKKNFRFVAGQYIHVTIPLSHHDPRGNGRDFSIASSPNDANLTIALRGTKSGFKRTLLEAEKQVDITGPFGVFTLPEDRAKPLVFIAGGIGITPFLSMVRFATGEKLPYTITLLYINRTNESAAYLDELLRIEEANTNFTLKQHLGHLTQLHIQENTPDISSSLCFIAGSPQMVTDTMEMVRSLGVSQENLFIEEFSGYKGEFEAYSGNGVKHIVPIGDISEDRKKLGEGMEGELAQRSLSDLEALLQALNNTAIVSETNAQGNITFVNDKFVEISKYPKEELLGQNHRILKSGYHSRAFYENLWATITRGKLWRGQMKNKAKDGSYYWVDTSIAPILSKGKPMKYISVRFPVTERQLAEEELKERAKQQGVLTILSQEALASYKLQELFDNAVNLLAQTLDMQFCAIYKLLPGGKHMVYEAGTGFSHVVKGQTLVSAENTKSMAGYTLAVNEPVIVEDLTTESRFAGSALLHDNSIVSGISVIIHGQEQPFGVLTAYTKKKKVFVPEDINFLQAVANLLANAARNQLDKRKDEFLGLASHELRTPLTSIKTFTQLHQKHAKKQKDEQALLFLAKVDTQLNRLTALIGELLDISRINAGKIEYKDIAFMLSELIEEVVEEQQMITKKKIILENGVTGKVRADRDRIGQVLTNLISNAIKYSPDSDKIILRTIPDTDKVTVSVQDFGVGIPAGEVPHIFDRFFRGEGKKKDDFPGGLGLGLFLCFEIIKRYQGRIWVESSEGQGSTFFFTLPYKKSS